MWSIATRVQRRELPVSQLRQLFTIWADMQSSGQQPNPSALSAVMIAYNQLRCFNVTLQLRKAFHEVDLRPQGHRALLIAASEAADVTAAVDAMKVLEADGVQLGRREYESLLMAALRAEDSETVDAALEALDQLPGRTSGRVHETLLQQCLDKKQYSRAAGAVRWLVSDVRSLLAEDPHAMKQPRHRNFALVTRRVLDRTIVVAQEQLACAALGALALSGRGMSHGELIGRLSAAAARGEVQLADALLQQHCGVSMLQVHLTHQLPIVDSPQAEDEHGDVNGEGGPHLLEGVEGGSEVPAAAPPTSLFALPSDTDAGMDDDEEKYTPKAAAHSRGGLFTSMAGASKSAPSSKEGTTAPPPEHSNEGGGMQHNDAECSGEPSGPPVYTTPDSTHPLTPAMGGAILRAALVARDWHSAYAALHRAHQLGLSLPRAAIDDAATLLAATLQLSTGTERAYLGERIRDAFEAGVVNDLVPYGTHGHNVLLAVAARADRHQRSRDASFVFQLAQALFDLDSVRQPQSPGSHTGTAAAGSDSSITREQSSEQCLPGDVDSGRPCANLTTFELMALGCSEPLTVMEGGEEGGHAALQVLQHAESAGVVPSKVLFGHVAFAQAAAGAGAAALSVLHTAADAGEALRPSQVERIARMLARHGCADEAAQVLDHLRSRDISPSEGVLAYLAAHAAGEAQMYDLPAPAMREAEWTPQTAW